MTNDLKIFVTIRSRIKQVIYEQRHYKILIKEGLGNIINFQEKNISMYFNNQQQGTIPAFGKQ